MTDISLYDTNQLFSITESYSTCCVAHGENIYYFSSGGVYCISGSGSTSLIASLPESITGNSTIGISSDGLTIVVIGPTSGGVKIFTLPSIGGSVNTYSYSGGVSLFYPRGNIIVYSPTIIFLCDPGSATQGVIKVTLSGSNYTTQDWIVYTSGSGIAAYGCVLLPDDTILFTLSASVSSLWCGPASGGSITYVPTVVGTPQFVDISLFSIGGVYYVLLPNITTGTIEKYVLDVPGKSVYSLNSSPILPTTLTGVTNSNSGGNQPGNLRIYATSFSSTSILTKVFNTNPLNGEVGTPIGGDPHITTFNGKVITVGDEREYVLLQNDEVKITFDSFSVRGHEEVLSPEQLRGCNPELSYFNSFTFTLYDCSPEGGESPEGGVSSPEGGVFSPEGGVSSPEGGCRKVRTRVTLHYDLSSTSESGKGITLFDKKDLSNTPLLELRCLPIKNISDLESLIGFRKVRIATSKNIIYLEFTRVDSVDFFNCYVSVLGSLSSFKGMIIDGECIH